MRLLWLSLACAHALHEPLSDYLDHRWVAAQVGDDAVLIKVGPADTEPRLAAEIVCRDASPEDADVFADCAAHLQALIDADVGASPSFNAAFFGAARGAPVGGGERGPRVLLEPPAAVSRSDALVLRWRLDEPFEVGADGVVCVVVMTERAGGGAAPAKMVTAVALARAEPLTVFGLRPAAYVVYAQVRDAATGAARGPLTALRHALVATASPVDRADEACASDGRKHRLLDMPDACATPDDPTRTPWLRVGVAGADDRQGARVDAGRLLDGDLDLVFRYDPRVAARAARTLGVAVGDLDGCVHLGSHEENDVGVLLGCVGLSAAAPTARLRVGAPIVRRRLEALVDAVRVFTTRAAGGDGANDAAPVVLTAHAQVGPSGASATAPTAFAVPLGWDEAPEATSGFPDLDALRRVVAPFETRVGGSLDKPRKQKAIRDAVAAAAARMAPGDRPLHCETGFNAGYSASAALSAGADVMAFDVGHLAAVHVGLDFLRRSFPGRSLELHVGDSCKSLAGLLEVGSRLRRPGSLRPLECDVVFVDGGHDFEPADCDVRLLSALARENATVIVDDVNADCETVHRPGLCDGPLLAWRAAAADGLLGDGVCDDEGFCVATYAARDASMLASIAERRAVLDELGFE